jgi:hypothetical protein
MSATAAFAALGLFWVQNSKSPLLRGHGMNVSALVHDETTTSNEQAGSSRSGILLAELYATLKQLESAADRATAEEARARLALEELDMRRWCGDKRATLEHVLDARENWYAKRRALMQIRQQIGQNHQARKSLLKRRSSRVCAGGNRCQS